MSFVKEEFWNAVAFRENTFKGTDSQDVGELAVISNMVTEQTVTMNEDKSPGVENILTKYLFLTALQLGMALMIIMFNWSLKRSIVPGQWKEATIIYLFNKDSGNKNTNYKPASNM